MPIPTESPPSRSERNNALQLAELLAATIDLVYPPGTLVRRDAHPKHHAVVRGEFVVSGDVPDDLKHGIFATPGRVPAWIRFSNGSPLVRPDRRRDQRGCAIKLVGIPGPKLLEHERDAVTQDFLLASARASSSETRATTSGSREPRQRNRRSACWHSSSGGTHGSGAATSSVRWSAG